MFRDNNHQENLDEEWMHQRQAYSGPSPSSEAIPMPKSHVHRTKSELDLVETMKASQDRELTMFHRIVDGIRDRQRALQENGVSLAEHAPMDVRNEHRPPNVGRGGGGGSNLLPPEKDLTFPRLSQQASGRSFPLKESQACSRLNRATLPCSNDTRLDEGRQWYLDECMSLSAARSRREQRSPIPHYNPPSLENSLNHLLPQGHLSQATETHYDRESGGLDQYAPLVMAAEEEKAEDSSPFQLEL